MTFFITAPLSNVGKWFGRQRQIGDRQRLDDQRSADRAGRLGATGAMRSGVRSAAIGARLRSWSGSFYDRSRMFYDRSDGRSRIRVPRMRVRGRTSRANSANGAPNIADVRRTAVERSSNVRRTTTTTRVASAAITRARGPATSEPAERSGKRRDDASRSDPSSSVDRVSCAAT